MVFKTRWSESRLMPFACIDNSLLISDKSIFWTGQSFIISFFSSVNTEEWNPDAVRGKIQTLYSVRNPKCSKTSPKIHTHILNTTPNSTIHVIAKRSASASDILLGSLKAWAYHGMFVASQLRRCLKKGNNIGGDGLRYIDFFSAGLRSNEK